jgi:hypothetical protein
MWLTEITAERAVRRIDMTPLRRHFTTELNMLVKLIIPLMTTQENIFP